MADKTTISCSCGEAFEPEECFAEQGKFFVDAVDTGELCIGVVCPKCAVEHWAYLPISEFVEGEA